MKIKLFMSLVVILVSSHSFAAEDPYKTYTGESLQCKLADGKDLKDVLKMVKKDWYALTDSFPAPYEGWVITPNLRSESDVDFDFAWLGFTNNNTDMGAVTDWFNANGSSAFTKWEKLTVCKSYSHWDIFQARQPTRDFTEGTVDHWAISSCSFKDGKGTSNLRDNDKAWNEYLDGVGHDGGVWRWWPGAGTPTDFKADFLLNMSFGSLKDFGKYRDARLKSRIDGSLPDSVISCDAPRLYVANNIKGFGG
jgi:hypothetical protein|tara:strand:- start:71 stop:823 length:753 start_codon:yes stop_codon:yes gene_type:complete